MKTDFICHLNPSCVLISWKRSAPTTLPRLVALISFFLSGVAVLADADQSKPNVLFITIDDMNDWISVLDIDAPIHTPNLERLAERGVTFTKAYCASPACNPSRTATLTGKRPTTSGVYGNKSDWRTALIPGTITLPRYFKDHGYQTEGTGKIFHHHGDVFHDDASFHSFTKLPLPPDNPMPEVKLNNLPNYGNANTDWGIWPPGTVDNVDIKTVNDAIQRLDRLADQDDPFFLAVGIFRPHMPFFAPAEAFDEYPEDRVIMPPRSIEDMKDIPQGRYEITEANMWLWEGMVESMKQDPNNYRGSIRAYQACATFADSQVGRLLDALDASGRRDNTIIVLWSDHGFHLGEKEHWEKFALWEKSNHIPFIVVAPGITPAGERCLRPVDMTVMYPTLIELAGLPGNPDLDGVSIVPLLKDPKAEWDRPALMTYHKGNHAVRSERWRYIRYANGDEELYDHTVDSQEWNNLIGDPRFEKVVAEHRQWLPKKEADLVAQAYVDRANLTGAKR